jgi:nicotinamide-nucleotide amidase
VTRHAPFVTRIDAAARACGATVALAESLTGGRVAATIVDRPGVSAWFTGAIVTYSSALKTALLGVRGALLDTHGAASEPVAIAMAEGVLATTGATVAAAVTGVAGPGPDLFGTPEGTVHIAVITPAGTLVRRLDGPGSRETIRTAAVAATLELLADALETYGERRARP